MNCPTFKTVLLALILTVSLCNAQPDFQQINKACLAEARVTEAELKDFFMNGMKEADAKDNIKCHMKCVMEKKGHLKNGVFDEAACIKTMKEIPQLKNYHAEIEAAVRDCKNERGTNDCDTAFKITNCLKEYKAGMKP